MTKTQKSLLPLAAMFLSLSAAPALAETSFSGVMISGTGTVLFQARTTVPGDGSYTTLVREEATTGRATPLTFFPEEAELFNDGRQLQVRNRFGVFRTDLSLRSLAPVPGLPSFGDGEPVRQGRLAPVSSSPDGRFIVTCEPAPYAYGPLVLCDLSTGTRLTVAEGVECSLSSAPASWSPDGKFFIYRRGGRLYYFSVDQYVAARILEEGLRQIGTGSLASVQWSRSGDLYLVSGDLVSRIVPREFFPRTLYAGLISIGTIAGKLPVSFDPNADVFTLSPDGTRILLCRGGRTLLLVRLEPDDWSATGAAVLPVLSLPRDTCVRRVFWPREGAPTVVTRSVEAGKAVTAAYRLNDDPDTPPDRRIIRLDGTGADRGSLSPDERSVAVPGAGSVRILSYGDWQETARISVTAPRAVLWRTNDEVVVAGGKTIETCSISTGKRRLVAMAQAELFGFAAAGNDGEQAVRAQSDGIGYELAGKAWQKVDAFTVQPASTTTAAYRVYLEDLPAGPYRNMVMLRKLAGLETVALVSRPREDFDPFPASDEPAANGIFSHGSRIRRREVALVFDAVDSSGGLQATLSTLAEYGIRATFFVNGEFMRENPGAAKDIAGSGHEVGSMFFANCDLTDARYRIDAEFVKRGLARTEDDWFALTGHELALLWHAPYRVTNSRLVDAAAEMNYRYVGADVEPLDWVPQSGPKSIAGMYRPANTIIERIMAEKKPGSIIPVRIGATGREDYLVHELGLLINALLERGYDLVPVSTLMEHAR